MNHASAYHTDKAAISIARVLLHRVPPRSGERDLSAFIRPFPAFRLEFRTVVSFVNRSNRRRPLPLVNDTLHISLHMQHIQPRILAALTLLITYETPPEYRCSRAWKSQSASIDMAARALSFKWEIIRQLTFFQTVARLVSCYFPPANAARLQHTISLRVTGWLNVSGSIVK